MAEQTQMSDKRTLGEWTRIAAETSASIMSSSPSEGLERLSEFASAIASEGARRAVRGGRENLGAEEGEEQAARWSIQMAALSKQSMALSRQQTGVDVSSALGSFVAFYDQVGVSARTDVLNFDAHLAASDPRWGATIEAFAKIGLVPLARLDKPKAPGAEGGPSDFESSFMRQAHVGQSWSALGAPEADGDQQAGLDAWIDKIGDLKGLVAKSEVERGLSWGAQGASGFFVQSVDATLGAMGAGFVDMVRRSGIDPSSNPAIGASLVALSSMMSEGAGGRLLASIPLASDTPEQLASWDNAIMPAWQRSVQKWKAGAAVPAGATAESVVGVAEAARAPAGADLGRSASYASGRELGAGVRKTLSGFVDSFTPIKMEERMASVTERLSGIAERASARSTAGVVGLVDRANEATDRVEAKLRESLDKGLQAGAQKVAAVKGALQSGGQRVDNAIEDAALGMASARALFVGKVGDAKQAGFGALGSLAFKAKDALPSAEKIEGKTGKPLQTTMIQIASLAGALFVGVAMAPVAGLAAATVGAIAAGLGLGSAMSKAIDAARQKASAAPAALESIGQRLGAKRAERGLDRAEPDMEARAAAPGM